MPLYRSVCRGFLTRRPNGSRRVARLQARLQYPTAVKLDSSPGETGTRSRLHSQREGEVLFSPYRPASKHALLLTCSYLHSSFALLRKLLANGHAQQRAYGGPFASRFDPGDSFHRQRRLYFGLASRAGRVATASSRASLDRPHQPQIIRKDFDSVRDTCRPLRSPNRIFSRLPRRGTLQRVLLPPKQRDELSRYFATRPTEATKSEAVDGPLSQQKDRPSTSAVSPSTPHEDDLATLMHQVSLRYLESARYLGQDVVGTAAIGAACCQDSTASNPSVEAHSPPSRHTHRVDDDGLISPLEWSAQQSLSASMIENTLQSPPASFPTIEMSSSVPHDDIFFSADHHNRQSIHMPSR